MAFSDKGKGPADSSCHQKGVINPTNFPLLAIYSLSPLVKNQMGAQKLFIFNYPLSTLHSLSPLVRNQTGAQLSIFNSPFPLRIGWKPDGGSTFNFELSIPFPRWLETRRGLKGTATFSSQLSTIFAP